MDSREIGASRLSRVESLAPAVKRNTTASGCELLDTEMQALRADWKQWEDSVFQTQTSLENLVSQMALSEQEFSGQVAQLEQALEQFSALLTSWTQQLALLEGKNTDDHLMYLDAVQEFTDWLHSAKEELHRWSDMSGDSPATQKKLSKIKVRK